VSASLFLLLFVFLGAAALYLRSATPPVRDVADVDPLASVERAFWSSTGPVARARMRTLLSNFPTPATRRRVEALLQLGEESRHRARPIEQVATIRRGARDVCRFTLADGRRLELIAYDDRQVAQVTRSCAAQRDLGLRLRWIEGLGWSCSVHDGLDSRSEQGAVATLLAWDAEVVAA
jgi:hypothetical protein